MTNGTLALLLESTESANKMDNPAVKSNLDGKNVTAKIEQQKKRWEWIKINVKPGWHKARFIISVKKKKEHWKGKAGLWLICREKPQGDKLLFRLSKSIEENRPMPPHPWPSGEIKRNIKIGEAGIKG